MTTEQATQIIAMELKVGFLPPELKALKEQAGCILTEDEWDKWVRSGKKEKYTPKAQKYQNAIGSVNAYARGWEWTRTSKCIEAAYAFLGAPHPVMGDAESSTGYAYHKGIHPIQEAAELIAR